MTGLTLFKVIFLASAGLLVYTWAAFPVLLWTLRKIRKKAKATLSKEYTPVVSVIVAAFNEEKVIGRRIDDILGQDYPMENVELIIASDGSSDRTVEIARKYALKHPNIKVLDFRKNRGKASVHNDSVREARGEILLFTDAETVFEKDFIRASVKYFEHPANGCGAGDFTFRHSGAMGKTESRYWDMEKTLRRWEAELGLLPFASGGCFLLRRSLYKPIPAHSDIDNILTLHTVEKGFRLFYAKDARAYDYAVEGSRSHFKKRYRTTLRSMGDMLWYLPNLVKARRWAVLWVLFSHRLIRWCTGLLASSVFLSNLALGLGDAGPFFKTTLLFQAGLMMIIALGWVMERTGTGSGTTGAIRIAYAFFLANAASTLAIFKLLRRERIASWKN